MSKNIVITGASSGFGAMTARALADAGHTVYAGMRHPESSNAAAVEDWDAYAKEQSVNLHAVAMDVTEQDMVNAAIAQIIDETGRLDVVVHNAGHMVLGPTEAFSVEQIADLYDVNVLSTQRANRAALPHLRAQRDGLLVWVRI
jgi:NADP-dependent 3-hydroxy acid dehydrogenase YdfG